MPKKPNRHKRGRIWKVKNTSQRKTEGRYRKCYTPHTLDIFLFHCTSWLRNTPCKRITIYIKRPTYTLSVYQNKLPALDDFLITFLMKANFQNKIHMKLLETVNRSNFQVAQTVKNPPAMQETWVPSLGFQDPLEQGLAYDSSMVAWRIPWTVESGRL